VLGLPERAPKNKADCRVIFSLAGDAAHTRRMTGSLCKTTRGSVKILRNELLGGARYGPVTLSVFDGS
jgi:hypothetical protein